MIIGMASLGRLGKPEDIADVVAFLCSEDARWRRDVPHRPRQGGRGAPVLLRHCGFAGRAGGGMTRLLDGKAAVVMGACGGNGGAIARRRIVWRDLRRLRQRQQWLAWQPSNITS